MTPDDSDPAEAGPPTVVVREVGRVRGDGRARNATLFAYAPAPAPAGNAPPGCQPGAWGPPSVGTSDG